MREVSQAVAFHAQVDGGTGRSKSGGPGNRGDTWRKWSGRYGGVVDV